MKTAATNSGFGYVIHLEKGDKLVASLKAFAEKEDVTGFFYGLGAVTNVEIGRRNTENKEYEFETYDGVMELASLSGNIAHKDSEVVVHAHGVLGDEKLRAIAGHINEAEVAITVEIFLHLQHGTNMTRVYDEESGLDLLEFE